ncbi:MAG: PKD domain-containing protein [candidate division KSB1 bacterium]|nr:PKD domain-containing protein [candidate division KSB1 bacterium]MDZ7303230.1 PKD domain-containing protein [candidate division KSB1 bacterium]MDZ7312158.1 PKD domain-containing protein [candidate division KSB1 bacterium]
MKRIALLVVVVPAVVLGVLFFACEKHKDPFSAQNTQPVITDFRFKPDPNLPNIGTDSLKYKPGSTYALHLEYEDREFRNLETKKLRAYFSFESGSGKISHDKFMKPGDEGLTFEEVPGKFNGDLLFMPGAPGLLRVKLQLSDGVKSSETRQASATFFENLRPIPVFTVRLLTQTNPYRVEFNPERSQDRDGDIAKAKFIWTFGDNSKADTVLGKSIITHEYTLAGQYRARLRITDEEGKADSTEQLVTTNNQPPVAALRVFPLSGKVPLEIEYNAAGSFDPDGSISSYQVFFGDGETAQDASGKHTYKTDANYQVLLIVKDNLGLADTTNVAVRVSTPPIAELKINPETGGAFPLDITISGKNSSDPHPNGKISAYRILVTNLSTNSQQLFPQDSVSTVFTTPANYLVTLEVTNIRGLTGRAEKVVPAINLAPVADFVYDPLEPQRRTRVTFTSTSYDPNRTDGIVNYRWSWGDGSQEQSGQTLATVEHEFTSAGTYLVKLVVTDAYGLTGQKQIQLVVK